MTIVLLYAILVMQRLCYRHDFSLKMVINVKVMVNASKSEIMGFEEDLFGNKTLRVRVSATPQDGKANIMLIKLLATHFNVSRSDITIIKGATSRTKLIRIKQLKLQ
ncbi:DUF167 domain-containing protein [Candidatus Fokinia crypta]|uniref:UPF0235 protein Fokcrypt_00530 n=1 Tax=Candidatus Fokinia crypta TaxID=1920990 RepID=A0ABZ0UPE7_9RICK|nr:DUF167 domain-containing protein [Candidatus Fokinia cryptica]WPX98003.1 DUF167 domain-containing protein [Candidatus Fokinia cryptica]